MRRLVLSGLAALLLLPASPALAHGIGGRQDLPVPLRFFIGGAGTVIVLSFVALAVLWPKPRMQQPPIVRTLAGPFWRPLGIVFRTVGMATLVLVVLAGVVGIDNSTANPGPVLVFVVFGSWCPLPQG